MTKNDSGEHFADAGKVVSSGTLLHAAAAQLIATIATRFSELCQKFGISEDVAGALLTGTLLLDEPLNAAAFEDAWSDIHNDAVAAVEAVHGVTVEADCCYVEVTANDTGESVLCMWGDMDAIDRSEQ